MIVPPAFIRMGFGWRFRLWLPLFLLWPLGLLLIVIVLPLTVIADLVLYLTGQRFHGYTILFVGVLGILNATRGLTAVVHSGDTNIDFKLV